MTPFLRLPCVDDLSWCALTVYMEAEGEPWEGQLGVAYVITNRAERWGKSVSDVVLGRWAFSSWNQDTPRRMALDTLDIERYRLCFRAACAAFLDLAADPTHGADHFLNVEAVKAANGGRLPTWAAAPGDLTRVNPAKVTAVLGAHTFLRLT